MTRAVVIEEFGGPEVLTLREVERPRPGPGQVLVRVMASGTNPVEAKIRQGKAIPDLPLPAVLGGDVSGVVKSVGAGVTDLTPGDEVYYTPEMNSRAGSYADYNVVSADVVALKPHNLSHTEAAAIPLAGGTAWEAIVRRLAVRPGETVLVHAGAGGVGSFAVQFAVAAGAQVLATAGTDHQQLLTDLGATAVDYQNQDVVDSTRMSAARMRFPQPRQLVTAAPCRSRPRGAHRSPPRGTDHPSHRGPGARRGPVWRSGRCSTARVTT